jgi:hypothetical protein
MTSKEQVMLVLLRVLAGLALGPAMLAATMSELPKLAPPSPIPAIALEPARAQVAVSFDRAGRIAAAALVRSSGSRAADSQAREAAMQLASLEPADAAAGRTHIFSIAFATRP